MQNRDTPEIVRPEGWDTYEAAIDAGDRMFRIMSGLDFDPESNAEEVKEEWLGADPSAAESQDYYKAAKFIRDYYLKDRDPEGEYQRELENIGAKLDYVPWGDWQCLTSDNGSMAIICIAPCEGGNQEAGENWVVAEFHTIRGN
jgi:hypothetical protein